MATLGPSFNCYTQFFLFVFRFFSLTVLVLHRHLLLWVNLPAADPASVLSAARFRTPARQTPPISFLQLISQTWFCFPAQCFYLLLVFGSQEVRLLISFCLQGLCRNFWRPCFRKQPVAEDVHIDKDRAIEWMCVCAFLPVRVREFVLFVLVLSWASCWFFFVTGNILFTHLSLQ